MGLAQGLSLVRAVFSVEMTAVMGSDLGAEAKAWEMSVGVRGVPVMMERLACGVRASGRRTRAVTVWLRARASARARPPVRPLAPRRRIRIVVVVVVVVCWLSCLSFTCSMCREELIVDLFQDQASQ